jgi:phospholipid/cholesterol/gamma-HCH transport system permease protein
LLGNFIKPAVYGFLISLLGCYFGMQAKGGASGVGRASTNALVVSAILIVFFDYYIGTIWL